MFNIKNVPACTTTLVWSKLKKVLLNDFSASRIDTKIEEYKKIWGDIPGIGPDYSSAADYSWGDLPGEFDEYSPGTKDTSHSSSSGSSTRSYTSDYQYEAEYIPYKVKNSHFMHIYQYDNREYPK